MITAVDTNILLDILIPNLKHCDSSKNLLDMQKQKGALAICETVYAELASQFDSKKELDAFLFFTGIKLWSSNPDSLFWASRRWLEYLQSKKKGFSCAKCGLFIEINCEKCEETIIARQHILSDFLIGAHALKQADALLTRDRGYYRKYFDTLKLIVSE